MSANQKEINTTFVSYINHDYRFKNGDGVIGVYTDEDQVFVFIEDRNSVTRFSIVANPKDDSDNLQWLKTEEPRESQTHTRIRALRQTSLSWAESQVDRSALMAFKEDMIELASKSYPRVKIHEAPTLAAKESRITLDFHRENSVASSRNSG